MFYLLFYVSGMCDIYNSIDSVSLVSMLIDDFNFNAFTCNQCYTSLLTLPVLTDCCVANIVEILLANIACCILLL